MLDQLICDCDGVLVDSESIAERVLLHALGVSFPAIDFTAEVKTAFGQRTSRFLTNLETRYGIKLPKHFLRTVEQRTEAELARSLQPIPGVRDALLRVPLPRAVASNSHGACVRLSLARTDLEDLFGEHIFSADQVARPKPYPDLYLHAAAVLGVAPARCLVIEDSLSGLTAARAAGMRTIAFAGGSHVPRDYETTLHTLGFSHTMRSMRELPALVEAAMEGKL